MLGTSPVVLRFPFQGRWIAENSPANRVPSHGTHLFGTTFAIDFVAVDERGRSAKHGWRFVLAAEPPVLTPTENRATSAKVGSSQRRNTD